MSRPDIDGDVALLALRDDPSFQSILEEMRKKAPPILITNPAPSSYFYEIWQKAQCEREEPFVFTIIDSVPPDFSLTVKPAKQRGKSKMEYHIDDGSFDRYFEDVRFIPPQASEKEPEKKDLGYGRSAAPKVPPSPLLKSLLNRAIPAKKVSTMFGIMEEPVIE